MSEQRNNIDSYQGICNNCENWIPPVSGTIGNCPWFGTKNGMAESVHQGSLMPTKFDFYCKGHEFREDHMFLPVGENNDTE